MRRQSDINTRDVFQSQSDYNKRARKEWGQNLVVCCIGMAGIHCLDVLGSCSFCHTRYFRFSFLWLSIQNYFNNFPLFENYSRSTCVFFGIHTLAVLKLEVSSHMTFMQFWPLFHCFIYRTSSALCTNESIISML